MLEREGLNGCQCIRNREDNYVALFHSGRPGSLIDGSGPLRNSHFRDLCKTVQSSTNIVNPEKYSMKVLILHNILEKLVATRQISRRLTLVFKDKVIEIVDFKDKGF